MKVKFEAEISYKEYMRILAFLIQIMEENDAKELVKFIKSL